MTIIRKTFPFECKAVDEAQGIYEIMITTEDQDRQNDFVRATGGKIENYLRNPIVLFGHDYSDFPVARTLSLEIMPGRGIKAKFQFAPVGAYEKADIARRLFAANFLGAASIGFIPITAIPLDPKSPWGAQDYVEWELLEWSLVSVPANQSALRLALDQVKETISKRGRVLSAANEKKLRGAADALQEVLDQLGETTPEEDPEKQLAEDTPSDTKYPPTGGPNIDAPAPNDVSPEVVESLSNFFSVLKGLLS